MDDGYRYANNPTPFTDPVTPQPATPAPTQAASGSPWPPQTAPVPTAAVPTSNPATSWPTWDNQGASEQWPGYNLANAQSLASPADSVLPNVATAVGAIVIVGLINFMFPSLLHASYGLTIGTAVLASGLIGYGWRKQHVGLAIGISVAVVMIFGLLGAVIGVADILDESMNVGRKGLWDLFTHDAWFSVFLVSSWIAAAITPVLIRQIIDQGASTDADSAF